MERGSPREEGAPNRETQFSNWLTSGTVSGAAAKGSTATGGERCHVAARPQGAERAGRPVSDTGLWLPCAELGSEAPCVWSHLGSVVVV